MKIEAGKYYRTRDGQKVGPMRLNTTGGYTGSHPWRGEGTISADCWQTNGSWHGKAGCQTEHDLIAEWTDAPDLTALTAPFGLLDRETQEALKAHGGPFLLWAGSKWLDRSRDDIASVFDNWYCYRVKPLPPAPPKPREFWIDPDHGTFGLVLGYLPDDPGKLIHVREVLPETN